MQVTIGSDQALVGAFGHARSSTKTAPSTVSAGSAPTSPNSARFDEKIAYLARYDTLTGLPNRLMLTEALGEAMRYAEQWRTRCAFLMIDLDRFKAVNDTLGHQVGDQLLAQVSARLKRHDERQ